MAWEVNREMLEGGGVKTTVTVPDDDILGKPDDDGKRRMKFPMRKLVAKLQNACGGRGWKYSDGWRGHDGFSTFILFKDNN